ncbi:hypothetical protein ACTA71_004027 [Dictyostelium dimigraforme]
MKFNNNIVIKEFNNGCRKIILDRGESLNSINLKMSNDLFKKLNQYNNDGQCKFIILSSNDSKSFSTGGDLKELVEKSNSSEGVLPILNSMYSLMYLIHTFKKPIISFMNGFVIGSGVGLSIHCSHKVVSENVKWSMPENKVGYFPDVGTSYYLSKIGPIGLYLAMVGNFINSVDLLKLKIANNFIPFKSFDNVINDLSTTSKINSKNDIDRILKKYNNNNNILKINRESSHLIKFSRIIQRCFNINFKSVTEILNNLNYELEINQNPEEKQWIVKTINTLMNSCPTSVCVSFENFHRSKNLDIKEILLNENRIGNRLGSRKDLNQGVYKALVDKSFTPIFNPSSIYDVNQSFIDSFFSPFEDEKQELFKNKLYN